MIYFDNAATTQVYPEVLKTYTEVATKSGETHPVSTT